MSRVFFLMVATFGVYFIFWFYWVSKELLAYNNRKGSPGLWVVGLGLILTFPLVAVIPIWKLSQQVSAASDGKYSTFFVWTLGIFIIPLVVITQRLLNEIALEQQASGVVRRPTESGGPSEPPVRPESRGVPDLVPPPALRKSPEASQPPRLPGREDQPEPQHPPPPEPVAPPAQSEPQRPLSPPEPVAPPEPAWPAGQEEPADLREVGPPGPPAGDSETSQSEEQRGESNT